MHEGVQWLSCRPCSGAILLPFPSFLNHSKCNGNIQCRHCTVFLSYANKEDLTILQRGHWPMQVMLSNVIGLGKLSSASNTCPLHKEVSIVDQ